MNKAAERDLLSLLPSITLPLPRELVEVAVSLLSQSRNKASSLKQDEEIARGYVCANIACNRLKRKLNLPTIIVRPPVGPTIYKKVYAYLDSVLTAGAPHKQQKIGRSDPSAPSESGKRSTNGTPIRTPATTSHTNSAYSARSLAKRKYGEREGEREGDSEAPSWVMRAIRLLCRAFKLPQAAPHIYVGVVSISKVIREQQEALRSTPSKKRAKRAANMNELSRTVVDFDEAHIPALIIVVMLFTSSHMFGAPRPDEYSAQRQRAISTIKKSIPGDVDSNDDTTVAMIEDLLREAENGWLDLDWYHNLPEPLDYSEDSVDQANDETCEQAEENARPFQGLEVPRRGFGSMMTDATNWLSDERKAEYQRWKSGLMKQIVQVEK